MISWNVVNGKLSAHAARSLSCPVRVWRRLRKLER